MNVLSLFDGMSCGQIALERAGIKVDKYYASEIDKYAIQITQKNYPDTIQLGDVTKWREWDLPKIDLILAGSPCQGFSFAGKQLAFDDPRSKLFFTFIEIKDHYEPDNFLLENVKMKTEYLDVISGCLNRLPVLINSSLVSGQLRSRNYWASFDIEQPEDRHISLSYVLESGYYADREKSYCIDACYAKGSNFRRYFYCGSRQIVLEKGYAPSRMTKDTANAIMHQEGNRWRLLKPSECERLQTVPVGYTDGVPKSQQYKMLGNGWTVDVIVHILTQINLNRRVRT